MTCITDDAGFIGSNFLLDWLVGSDEPVINLDKQTYAGNLENLASLQGEARRGLDQMMQDAWRWQSMNPNGFES